MSKIALLILFHYMVKDLLAQHVWISSDERYLTASEGKPFFYLGDTAWELFHCLDREEAVTGCLSYRIYRKSIRINLFYRRFSQ
jgi:hypothetical protein